MKPTPTRLRRRITLTLLVAAIATFWFALPYIWLPRGTSTINLWWAADTFHQCSRDTPRTDGSYWLPTGHDIVDVERGLWYLMYVRDRRGLPVAGKFTQYHRQYIGFRRDGMRLIYVNVFPDIDELDLRDWTEWSNLTILGKPANICDGGNSVWGVVYNPNTQAFEEPAFNGP